MKILIEYVSDNGCNMCELVEGNFTQLIEDMRDNYSKTATARNKIKIYEFDEPKKVHTIIPSFIVK